MSLLYYFGMLTISGTYEGKTKLTIPNQVVREQLYAYLLSTYDEADLNLVLCPRLHPCHDSPKPLLPLHF